MGVIPDGVSLSIGMAIPFCVVGSLLTLLASFTYVDRIEKKEKNENKI
jgi:hypothetical protein